ncbi:hypothetical protein THAOC_06083, partial [Thalassiosira oceanica]
SSPLRYAPERLADPSSVWRGEAANAQNFLICYSPAPSGPIGSPPDAFVCLTCSVAREGFPRPSREGGAVLSLSPGGSSPPSLSGPPCLVEPPEDLEVSESPGIRVSPAFRRLGAARSSPRRYTVASFPSSPSPGSARGQKVSKRTASEPRGNKRKRSSDVPPLPNAAGEDEDRGCDVGYFPT